MDKNDIFQCTFANRQTFCLNWVASYELCAFLSQETKKNATRKIKLCI
jgi:hypothetical protein